jgi:hypothetical protein
MMANGTRLSRFVDQESREMTDMIERTLNRPGQQLHSYSMPGDSNCAATKALSAKPVDHRSPPTYTDFEETGTTASGGDKVNETLLVSRLLCVHYFAAASTGAKGSYYYAVVVLHSHCFKTSRTTGIFTINRSCLPK